jgi:ribosome biogenesis SPOUT family RNA methylase Rps3
MMTAERQRLSQAINALPEDRLTVVLDFVNDLCNEEPNAETAAVIAGAFADHTGKGRTRQDFFNAMREE